MTDSEAILLLAKCTSIYDVFSDPNSYDLSNWKSKYKELAQLLHPDRCNLSHADKAMSKLNLLKHEMEHGRSINDGVAEITYLYNGDVTLIYNDSSLALESVRNYSRLKNIYDSPSRATSNFHKYLPDTYTLISDNAIKLTFKHRIVPISRLQNKWSEEHTRWIVSRMLEFASWLDNNDFVLNSFTPDSIFVVPETHGIVIISFNHLAPSNTKLTSINNKWSFLCPKVLFDTKISSRINDLEMIKRMACYMLGDSSGIGTMLLKNCNKQYIQFMLEYSNESIFTVYKQYRELLKNNFTSKFYELYI